MSNLKGRPFEQQLNTKGVTPSESDRSIYQITRRYIPEDSNLNSDVQELSSDDYPSCVTLKYT
jgi:hypothetical protein